MRQGSNPAATNEKYWQIQEARNELNRALSFIGEASLKHLRERFDEEVKVNGNGADPMAVTRKLIDEIWLKMDD